MHYIIFIILALMTVSCSEVIEPGKVDTPSIVPEWVIGDWQFTDDTGYKTTVILYPDGSAIGLDNTIGSWYYIDDTIHIVWTNGWMNLIKKHHQGYIKLGFSPGVATDDPSTNESEATKLSK